MEELTGWVGGRVPPRIEVKLKELAVKSRRTKSEVLRMLIENAEPQDLIPPELREEDEQIAAA